ncbi:MAG: hypothetical protein Q9167_006010, partial [Letrouitia subvulpina]
MSTPGTPTKADNAIRVITDTITAKWGLQFPPIDTPRSPLQKDRGRPEEKVLSLLQYLYFHDKKNADGATDWAISNFEQYALQAHSQWVTKPNADVDVLPRRALRSESASYRNSLPKKVPLSSEMMDDLMQCLLRFLDEAFIGARRGLRYNINRMNGEKGTESDSTSVYTTPKSKRALESQRSPRKSSSHQSKIREYLLPVPAPAGPAKDALEEPFQSSNDAFNCSSDFFDDLVIGAPAKALSITPGIMERRPFASTWEPDQLEDEFKTPPESPTHLRYERLASRKQPTPTNTGHLGLGKEVLETNKIENAMGPPVSNRKRTFPEAASQPQPRKMSREKSISAGLLGNSPSSRQIEANDPREFSLPIPPIGLNAGPLHKAQSTDSLHSFATSGTSGPISASTSVWRSANTSANTSFDASTAATSFNCSCEPAELDGNAMLDSRVSDVCDPDWFSNGVFGSHLNLNPDAMEFDHEAPMKSKPLPMGLPQKKISQVGQLLQQLISKTAPFEPLEHCSASFRQLYETIRVAGNCGLSLSGFSMCLRKSFDDYEELWSSLASIVKTNRQTLPEKSKPIAWAMAAQRFDSVLLSGSLQYIDQPGEPIFRMSLKPLRLERSYRLSRQFGNDRFFILEIPGLDNMAVPAYLKVDQEGFYEAVVQWFASHEHKFLRRKWRAFYLKPEERKKSRVGKISESTFNEPRFRVYFFAIDGYDFRNENSVGEDDPRLLNHTKSTIAVSPTIPTIEFKPFQIIKTRDAINISPAVRSFQTDKMPINYKKPEGAVVMNDGCSRISKAAARAISEMLGLDDVPCVFQGRIGGAKGMWIVDALDEKIEGDDGLEEFWIEVTAEQLKFEPHPLDKYAPDSRRVTFDFNTSAKKLLPSSLNFQLMPILVDRGVPYEVFAALVEDDLTAKVEGLAKDMENPLDVLRWNKETAAAVEEKTNAMGVEMIGAVPNSTGDRIKWFIESGFHPTNCRFFKDILYKQASEYCLRLENRMYIGLGRSTSALMIADPLAVLEEGQVHMGFSSVFNDRKSGWSDIMLHNIDILVARSPALLPSDIQKVRAVFNPQLRMYRDVIVFSSKGSQSLASKLSG